MPSPTKTKFYGSQLGGARTTPQSYTSAPLSLLYQDVRSAFSFAGFLPFIVFPISPQSSGPFCELYPSWQNLWCMFLHLMLVFMQVPFVLSVPFWVFFPVWWVLIGLAAFWAVNQSVCWVLNGSAMEFPSHKRYVEGRERKEHEQWIFLNGVAVGKHWLQSNVDRLALTFGRPVLGVHNKTYVFSPPSAYSRVDKIRNGIIFDVIQCLIQRNFNYATQDVRDCYKIVKETLYQPNLTKVVFILHSQGGIEGGMIIDWLLQEVPQDLLAKLEVYTFGNAANHFNNPHLHLLSQHAAFTHPARAATTKTTTSVHYHDPLPTTNGDESAALNAGGGGGRTKQESTSGRTIRYIEHYAHTSDFVARWGVLHFTCNFSFSPLSPRFMGRVFERQGAGHQLNQHHLDNMFPLKPAPPSSNTLRKNGIGGSGFEGVDEEKSEFMNSILELGNSGTSEEKKDEREGLEMSYLGAHGEPLVNGEKEVLLRDMSPIVPSTMFGNGGGFTNGTDGGWNEKMEEQEQEKKMQFRVKDLSRLWLYVNGKSPKVDETDVGIARMATI